MKITATKLIIAAVITSLLLTLLIYFVGQGYIHPEFLPDQGAAWYYWKLPEVTLGARITGWGLFVAHLLITWFLAFKLKYNRPKPPQILNKYNVLLIITQIVFSLLHLIQTYFFYDTLAHDTPVWLSQVSVIIMLVFMMILLNDKRGLFFGKKIKFPPVVAQTTRLIHGPYIILAVVFTFWYHPMEPSLGHLIGFFYMFLLLSQIALAHTQAHFNKYWQFSLEFLVLIHGVAVALMVGNGMWPMFGFGFGAIAVITYIYLLNLPKFIRISLQLLYVVLAIIVYTGGLNSNRNIGKIYEITFIPFIEYLLVFVFAGIFILIDKAKPKKLESK